VLYSSDSVREEYRGRNDGSNPSVQLNDVAFASHALLISSLTLLQSFLYKRDANQHLSSFNRTFILAAMASIGLATIGVELIDRIGWLDFMYLLSYIKIYISFAKYVPQALLNIQRKSTIGWSIINILLDFTGGTLSL
jgi:cystinosin